MRSSVAISVAVAAALLGACSSESSSTPEVCRTFTTSLTVRDRMSQGATVFNTGEPITFELTTTNTTNAPATLTAASSCTAVVFEVFDTAQRRRWGNDDGIACLLMVQPRTFAALETVTESDTWDQRDAGGPVPRGAYTVTANVGQYASDSQGSLVDCRAALSKSAGFTIQ
jgi:hypothetical protein